MTQPRLPADPPGHRPLRRPPGRYDDPRTLPRAVLVTGAALLGVLLLGLAYVGYDRFGGSQVSYGVLGFHVLSDRAVEVRFEVRKSPSATVACLVRAREKGGTEVGSETVTLGPSPTSQVVTVHQLTTTRRATTGEVTGCWAPRSSAPPLPSP